VKKPVVFFFPFGKSISLVQTGLPSESPAEWSNIEEWVYWIVHIFMHVYEHIHQIIHDSIYLTTIFSW
jgi:hypothetical protein